MHRIIGRWCGQLDYPCCGRSPAPLSGGAVGPAALPATPLGPTASGRKSPLSIIDTGDAHLEGRPRSPPQTDGWGHGVGTRCGWPYGCRATGDGSDDGPGWADTESAPTGSSVGADSLRTACPAFTVTTHLETPTAQRPSAAEVGVVDQFPPAQWNHGPVRVLGGENAHLHPSPIPCHPDPSLDLTRSGRQDPAVLVRVAHRRNRSIWGIDGSTWLRSGTVPSEFIGQSLAVSLNERRRRASDRLRPARSGSGSPRPPSSARATARLTLVDRPTPSRWTPEGSDTSGTPPGNRSGWRTTSWRVDTSWSSERWKK
jgi:hypothetical protein